MGDDEIPEWKSQPDEEIPPALQKKWDADEKRGRQAGVCKECEFPFSEDDLSCRHCGRPTEIPSGFLNSISSWFLKTPWGIVTFFIIVLAVFLLLAF